MNYSALDVKTILVYVTQYRLIKEFCNSSRKIVIRQKYSKTHQTKAEPFSSNQKYDIYKQMKSIFW